MIVKILSIYNLINHWWALDPFHPVVFYFTYWRFQPTSSLPDYIETKTKMGNVNRFQASTNTELLTSNALNSELLRVFLCIKILRSRV